MIFSFRMNDFTKSVRFAGTQRLFGEDGLARLGNARVAIIGIGGVGSWAVETLARTGIGNLTLIDGDVVVESNINRQIQATDSTLGKPKVLALAERIALINPDCFVEPLQDFVRPENLDALVGNRNFDFVIDAIDSVRDKTALIAYCKERPFHWSRLEARAARWTPRESIFATCPGPSRSLCWRKYANACVHSTVLPAIRKTNSVSMPSIRLSRSNIPGMPNPGRKRMYRVGIRRDLERQWR